ncbi:glc operon protein GlcG [Mycobacterium sp. URHB0021]|jgi:glc operon protein GlcG
MPRRLNGALTMADIQDQRCITLAGATRALTAALHHAASIDVPVCVAVVDCGSNLVSFGRMDGAPLLSAQLAQDKGYSVIAFNGLATREWWDAIKDEPALVHGIVKTARLTVFGGGVAITEGEMVVGAVGVSGGSAEQDHEIAEVGAAAVGG